MIISFRCYSGSYDRPIRIKYLSTFVNTLFCSLNSEERSHIRLFSDDGRLIGRGAIYEGV